MVTVIRDVPVRAQGCLEMIVGRIGEGSELVVMVVIVTQNCRQGPRSTGMWTGAWREG